MDSLIKEKNRIEKILEGLKSTAADQKYLIGELSNNIRTKAQSYNSGIQELKLLKAEYKDKCSKVPELTRLVNQYREEQRKILATDFREQICSFLAQINSVSFEMKVSDFRKFDQLKALDLRCFPILLSRRDRLLTEQKHAFKNKILANIKEVMPDKSRLNDLTFGIAMLVRYEHHFGEKAFTDAMFDIVESRFSYHFQSNRDSNRLDKPEWFFEFLLREYNSMAGLFKIYHDAIDRHLSTTSETHESKNACINGEMAEGISSVAPLIHRTQCLVSTKMSEILRSSSGQKRKLIFHAASEFIKYSRMIYTEYGTTPDPADISLLLHNAQTAHIRTELVRVHELEYTQWFREYDGLFKDALRYIGRFGNFDQNFSLEQLAAPIAAHTRAFIDGLKFINASEARAVCTIFSQIEELKGFVLAEEADLRLDAADVPENISRSTVIKFSLLNTDILALICDLARSGVKRTLEMLAYFNYVPSETKRRFIVEMYRIVGDFSCCISYNVIEPVIVQEIDTFVVREILCKTRLNSDEFLDFCLFFKNTRALFAEHQWKAMQYSDALEALFDGESRAASQMRDLKQLYGL